MAHLTGRGAKRKGRCLSERDAAFVFPYPPLQAVKSTGRRGWGASAKAWSGRVGDVSRGRAVRKDCAAYTDFGPTA